MKTGKILLNLHPAKTCVKSYSMRPEGNKNFTQKISKELNKASQKLSSLYVWIQDDVQKYLIQRKLTEKDSRMISTWKFETLQSIFSKLLNKIKLQSSYVNSISTWKPRSAVSKTYIDARTKHFISLVISANSTLSLQKRLENLTSHLKEYPEAKISAVKEGAIPHLIRIRRTEKKNEEIQAELRESLSLLGHIDSLPNKGIRILSIDGGGTRGVVALEILKELEELTGKHTYQLFDLICGVSTGAILTCLLGPHKKSSEECLAIYKEVSSQIFNQSPLWGTRNLVMSHSYYDTHLFEGLLKKYIGNTLLCKTARDPACPKIAIVSTVVNKPQILAYIFRNYELPYRVTSQYVGSSRHEMWEAVRASSAAPSYFEDFRIGELVHQDGGVLVNNPTAVAIHEAQLLWPDSPLQCILSLGLGRKTDTGIHLSDIKQTSELAPDIKWDTKLPGSKVKSAKESSSSANVTATSWKTTILRILDSATDTEGVHTILHDLLPGGVYFRFNPHLTGEVTIDDARPEFLKQLEIDSAMYIRQNEAMFEEVAAALLTPKSTAQKCSDWLKLKHLEGVPSLLITAPLRQIFKK